MTGADRPAFLFSIVVLACLVIGILVVSHIGARKVAASKGLEEEPTRSFDEPAPAYMSAEEHLLRHIFGDFEASKVDLAAPSLPAGADEAGRVKVTRRRAQESADR